MAVVGPTAIGKTALGISLAQHFGTEIIGADSRQFFKEMPIGTAVPSTAELAAVPHHFIQHKSIFEPYSVGAFEQEALQELDRLFKTKEVVVLVGGSGLYVDAVAFGLDVFPKVGAELRKRLTQQWEREGLASLQRALAARDPEYYKVVDRQNPRRLLRALEVCLTAGQPYSSFLKQRKERRGFRALYVGLRAPREVVYERINARVDAMLEAGLLQEARSLYPYRSLNALQTVGYRELFGYFDGAISLDEAVAEIKKHTRRFAKRQLTWLRRHKHIVWVDHGVTPEIVVKAVTERLSRL